VRAGLLIPNLRLCRYQVEKEWANAAHEREATKRPGQILRNRRDFVQKGIRCGKLSGNGISGDKHFSQFAVLI
jgi:hypothetical protein